MALRLRVKELMQEKAKREGKKISANTIAKAIDVSHNTALAYMENIVQRPGLDVLEKLKDYFECSIEDLFEQATVIKEIVRITFAVNDMEKMVRFYNKVFALQLTLIENSPFYVGKMAGVELLMCPNEIAQVQAEQNRHQFRFLVGNLTQVLAEIEKAGGEQIGEIRVEQQAKLCGARDPEGNTMELVEYL